MNDNPVSNHSGQVLPPVPPMSLDNNQQEKQHLLEIGGWLLFFLISWTIITPISLFWNVFKYMWNYSPSTASLSLILGLDSIISIMIAGSCIYTGSRLWKKKAGSVQATMVALQAIWAWIGIRWLFISRFDLSIDAIIGLVIAPYFYTILWWNYLKSSKRVRNTYPPEAFIADDSLDDDD